MRDPKLLISSLLLFAIFSCNNCQKSTIKENVVEKTKTPEQLQNKLTPIDTLITDYPIKIVNDEAVIKVISISNDYSKNFFIELYRKNDTILSIKINKDILIDSNSSVFFLDSINSDYTKRAKIKTIKYKGIRANTLYFKTTLENYELKKEIKARFNLFYSTKRKGEIYGWITDEVKEIK